MSLWRDRDMFAFCPGSSIIYQKSDMERWRKTVARKNKQTADFWESKSLFSLPNDSTGRTCRFLQTLEISEGRRAAACSHPPEHPVFLAMWWARPRRHSAGQMLFSSYLRTKSCRWYLFLFQNLNNKDWPKLRSHRRYGSRCFCVYDLLFFWILHFILYYWCSYWCLK